MQGLGYLGVVPTRSTSPLFPKIYYVTGRGVRKLRQALADQGKTWQPGPIDRAGRHRHEGYSSEQVLHEILITEFLLAVWQTVQGRPDLELVTVQRRSLARHPAFQFAGARQPGLKPDALFLFRQKGGGMMCCLVEMDTGTMNRKQLAAKFRRYEAWAEAEAGKQYLLNLYRQAGATDPRPAFRLLVVAKGRAGGDDFQRLVDVNLAALGSPNTANRLWTTTVSELRLHQFEPLPLGAPIWSRGKDIQGSAVKARLTPILRDAPKKELFPEVSLSK